MPPLTPATPTWMCPRLGVPDVVELDVEADLVAVDLPLHVRFAVTVGIGRRDLVGTRQLGVEIHVVAGQGEATDRDHPRGRRSAGQQRLPSSHPHAVLPFDARREPRRRTGVVSTTVGRAGGIARKARTMNILYTATATATGDGRNGHVASDDGILDTDVRIPKEMGGAGGATNPEQLFAAGYAACFHSALKVVAGREGWTSPAPRSRHRSASAHSTTAGSASPSSSTCTPRPSTGRPPKRSSPRPIRCARTRTPRVATSTSP